MKNQINQGVSYLVFLVLAVTCHILEEKPFPIMVCITYDYKRIIIPKIPSSNKNIYTLFGNYHENVF